MLDKLEYGQIQYIVHVSLKSWMSLSIMTGISSSFSSLKDVASSISLLLKTIKSTPFVKISSFCTYLHFQPSFSLEVKRLNFFANYFIRSPIAFKCLHLNIVVMLFSLFLACLFTSFFLGFFGRVKNFSLFVSINIFLDFVFLLCSLLIISTVNIESILQNKFY